MTASATRSPLPPPKERRRLREARSLSEADVARSIGVTRATVRSWETGRNDPRGRKREAYAKLLASFTAPAAPAGEAEAAGAAAGAPQNPTRAEGPGSANRTPSPETGPSPGAEEAPSAKGTPRAEEVPEVEEASGAQETFGAPEAFDALYEAAAPGLVRQTYLLTGRRRLSHESVERAFQLAWQRWPEVAVDRDPAGWVRAVAYEHAVSPWHRLLPAHRYPDELPEAEPLRTLLAALQELPTAYRRTLLLHDGLGLGLPETAAETEASTPAAANRLVHARAAVAELLPELGDPGVLRSRLRSSAGDGAAAASLRPPSTVRRGCERRARTWTRAVVTTTALIAAATSFTLVTAPRQYQPPMSPARPVEWAPPPLHGPPLLTERDKELRDTLRAEPAGGPGRLVPVPH